MKRVLIVLVVLVAAVVVLAERVPAVRDRLPWLPRLPFLSGTQTASVEAGGEGGSGRGRRGGRRGSEGPIPVLVADARAADWPVTVDVLGTVQATNTVTVKSQVDGKLVEVDFTEGQEVRKGDVLARIDPAPFQAAYDQAVAKKAQDESILANGQADLARYSKLASSQYGSAQQADTQKALVAQTQAIIQQDQAAIESAGTTLGFATIRSPIDGRTGLRLVDAGNIVHASDATGIVTVTQVRPIAVVFSLPQQNLRQVNAAQRAAPLKVQALEGDDRTMLDEGTLLVVDNTVDQTTGTVKLKASFPNAKLQLWPGQFVNVRLFIETLAGVTVVPTPAIQRGPDGPFVFLAKPDDTVAVRKVTLDRQNEALSVVTAGLLPPDRVVTTGFTRLTEGAKVAVSIAPPAADPVDGKPSGAADGTTRPTLPGGERVGVPQPAAELAPAAADNPAAQPGTGDSANGQRRHRRGGTQP